MGKTIGIIIAVIVLIAGAGAGGFYGGTAYQAQQQTNIRTAFFNGRGGTGTASGTGATGAGGAGGAGGFGGGVAGTVSSINGNTLQVTTAQGVTTVTLDAATSILKSETGAASDLQPGQQVTVRGQRDSAGNVTATTIQVVPAGTTFGANGGPANGAGPNATPAAQS